MGLERGSQRWTIHGELDASQLCSLGCNIWYNRPSACRVYGVASESRMERSDYNRMYGKDKIPQSTPEVDGATALSTKPH